MKKKNNAALADAFRKLSSAAAEIAETLCSAAKMDGTAEAPAVENTAEPAARSTSKTVKGEASTPEDEIKFIDIRAILAAKAGEGYRAEVKEILSRHNASCLSDLESHPEDFAEILKEAEVIGNE